MRTRPRRSFTIIELLVVLSVIALMLGIGARVYFGLIRTTALKGETRAILAILQAARGTAVADRTETFVCIDPAEGRVYPFGRRTVGVWHFEKLWDGGNLTYGAFGQYGAASGGTARLADGKVGNALDMDAGYHLTCEMLRGGQPIRIPQYDAREGVAIEAWVAPTPPPSGSLTVMERGGWFGLSLNYDEASKKFALAAFAVVLDQDGSGYLRHSGTTAPVIPAHRWTHVRMSCHKLGAGVALGVNGVEEAIESSASEAAAAPASDRDTLIGANAAGTARFNGRLDEVMISAYAVDTAHQVTKKLALEAEGLADGNTIRFDADGKLAPVHNGSPPRILLKEYKGRNVVSVVSITVGAMGALDVGEQHN